MAEETIDIGLRIDASEIPSEMKKAFDEMEREMHQRGQVQIPGTIGERMGQSFARVKTLSGEAEQQGFLSKQGKQELEQNLRTLDTLHKRYFQDRVKESAELRKEYDHLKKTYDDQIAQYKQLGQLGATHEQKRMHPALLAQGQRVNTLHEQMTGPQRAYDERRERLQDLRDRAALIPVREPPPPPEDREDRGAFMGGIGRTALNFGRGLLGFGVGYGAYRLGSAIAGGITEEAQRKVTVADMAQRLRSPGMTAEDMTAGTRDLHPTLKPTEGTEFFATYSALAGRRSFAEATQAVTQTRALGFAPEQGANIFGQAQRLGIDQQNLFRGLGEEISNAKMRGREGEMYEALLHMAEALTERLGRVDAAQLTRVLGGMAESGLPGLQGTMGAQTAMRVDEAFRNAPILPAPDLRQVTMLMTMQRLGISDPVEMNRVQERGVLQDPRTARAMFATIEEMGGVNTFEGQQMARGMGLSIDPTKYAAERKAFTDPNAPKLLSFIERMLGTEEAKKITPQNMPAALDVAKTFQEREQRGEFKSEAQMREEFGKAIQSEANVMMTELKVRELNITRMQNISEAMGKGTEAYNKMQEILNRLIDPVLPKFEAGLVGVTKILEWIVGKMTLTKAEVNKQVSELFPEVAQKPAERFLNWLDNPPEKPSKPVEQALSWLEDPRSERSGQILKEAGGYLWNQATQTITEYAKPRAEALGKSAMRFMAGDLEQGKSVHDILQRSAESSGVPASLLTRVMKQESAFNPNAESPVGALGYMQLMPSSFPQYNRKQLLQPEINIPTGAEYLGEQIERFKSVEKGLAAYNMGPGALNKVLNNPKFNATEESWKQHIPAETRDYIKKILGDTGVIGQAERTLPPERAKTQDRLPSPFDPPMLQDRRGYLEQSMSSGVVSGSSTTGGELGLTGSLRVTVDVNQPDGRTTSTAKTINTGDSSMNIDLMRAAPGGRGMHAKQNSPNLAGTQQ